jgi:hypothetical protein
MTKRSLNSFASFTDKHRGAISINGEIWESIGKTHRIKKKPVILLRSSTTEQNVKNQASSSCSSTTHLIDFPSSNFPRNSRKAFLLAIEAIPASNTILYSLFVSCSTHFYEACRSSSQFIEKECNLPDKSLSGSETWKRHSGNVSSSASRLITNGMIAIAKEIKRETRRDIVSTIRRWRDDVVSRWHTIKGETDSLFIRVPIRKVYITLYVNIGFTITFERVICRPSPTRATGKMCPHSRMLQC